MTMRTVLQRTAAVLALLAALLLFAWTGRSTSVGSAAGRAGGPPRVALFVNGTLGDKSFYDAAARGLARAAATGGVRARVIEGGNDPTRWEAALTDLVDSGDFDAVVTGTFTMVGLVEKLAAAYPAARFIVFDASVDFARCRCRNVHAMRFRQAEAAYLAGHLAARLAGVDAPTVGAIGGVQIPVIDDFLLGYSAGAQAARPGLRVLRQYANSFSDPATAKEIAKAMYGQGAAVVFQVAGGSGQGVIEAAAEAGRWVIGVDSDQYLLYKDSHPERAARIVSSVMKNVDVAIERALGELAAGSLRWGDNVSLGLAEGGVGLATGAPGWLALPPVVVDELQALQAGIVAGRVAVPSTLAR